MSEYMNKDRTEALNKLKWNKNTTELNFSVNQEIVKISLTKPKGMISWKLKMNDVIIGQNACKDTLIRKANQEAIWLIINE